VNTQATWFPGESSVMTSPSQTPIQKSLTPDKADITGTIHKSQILVMCQNYYTMHKLRNYGYCYGQGKLLFSFDDLKIIETSD
jgi:hypothetical protein